MDDNDACELVEGYDPLKDFRAGSLAGQGRRTLRPELPTEDDGETEEPLSDEGSSIHQGGVRDSGAVLRASGRSADFPVVPRRAALRA